MSKDSEKSLFTIAYDEIIKSPLVTDSEFRLYMVMLSHCTKQRSDAPKVCRLPQEAMAGMMRMTIRGVRKLLRSLEQKELITTSQTLHDNRYPVYNVVTSPPPGICPEELRSTRTKAALDYVRSKGGVKELQRRKLPSRKAARRTGRPSKVDINVESADVSGAQVQVSSSLQDSVGGTPVPPQEELQFRVGGTPVPGGRNSSSPSGGTPVPPGTDVQEMSLFKSPNGLRASAPIGAFAPPSRTPRRPEDPLGGSEQETMEGVRRTDIKNPEDDVAELTPEQEAERKRRLQAIRKGTRTKINDVSKADESPQEPVKKTRRGAGPPPDGKDNTQSFVEKSLVPDPDKVSEVPGDPWGLYGHFCRVVRAKYPDAQLPSASRNGKYLGWAKRLLKQYSREQIYELIQLLVMDYDNFNGSRVFFKFKGTPTPTFDQLYCNADQLLTYIGRGIIAPPAVRYSAYAEDYNRRKGAENDITNENAAQGRTDVDPIEALRDQYLT